MAMPATFDPLVDFDGMWTTKLADRYLPLLDLPDARYECIDGRLVVSPTEVNSNSYGAIELSSLIRPAARAAGFYVSGPVNLTFSPGRWIVPDLTVLHTLPQDDEEDKWVPASYVLMPVEFVSRTREGRKRDFIDKPRWCAEAGIPFFMRVQIVRQLRSVEIELLKLIDGRYESATGAVGGREFVTSEPFEMRFTPRDLIP
jgi:Putative restriction endonuclease